MVHVLQSLLSTNDRDEACIHFPMSPGKMPEICVRYVQLTDNIDLQPNQATSIILAIYRMAGNFGGKIFWRIAENMSFGGIYFGG